jgi:hypothetical protein
MKVRVVGELGSDGRLTRLPVKTPGGVPVQAEFTVSRV